MSQHAADFRAQITQLESLTGTGTELVTVTVPPDKSISTIRDRVAQEYASAANIKTDRTRENVQRALRRVQRTLREYDTTPTTGLVVYAGVVDEELIFYVFDDLPTPVAESTYRCDDHFDVTPLRAAVTPDDTYGLIVIERGGAALGRLVGDRVHVIREFDSQVMGKTRAGGQSSQRFARERERQKHEFFQSVGRAATDAFSNPDGVVTGVVVGGTLGTAKEFTTGDYLDHRLKDRLLGTYSVEYATEQGLEELVTKAEAELLDADHREEREALEAFFTGLRDGDTVTYGRAEVATAVEYGAVETALLGVTIPRDEREDLAKAVADQGGDVLVIDAETERGAQFAENFGGVGALLRFPVTTPA